MVRIIFHAAFVNCCCVNLPLTFIMSLNIFDKNINNCWKWFVGGIFYHGLKKMLLNSRFEVWMYEYIRMPFEIRFMGSCIQEIGKPILARITWFNNNCHWYWKTFQKYYVEEFTFDEFIVKEKCWDEISKVNYFGILLVYLIKQKSNYLHFNICKSVCKLQWII